MIGVPYFYFQPFMIKMTCGHHDVSEYHSKYCSKSDITPVKISDIADETN